MKIPSYQLASLYMRIINSVVVVGFYYGFLSTFSSIGPSYLLLLQAHIKAIEEGEKESKKEVSAATGFLVGQLFIFVSIYYKPLHLALGGPHTRTFLVPFFLLLLYYRYNSENLSQPTGQTLMHNPSTQSIFLINLLFPLLNHLFFPSSRLARLVNIYTFRYNKKMLFVTSSFVGWLIGQILFMKWVRFVLVWLQQNYFVRAKRYIFSNEYLFYAFRFYQNVMFDLRMSMHRFSIILVFFTCLCTFGRMPLPLLTFQIKAETQAVEPNTQEAEEKKRIPEHEKAESLQNRKNPGVVFKTVKLPIHFDQKTYRFDKGSLSSYVHYFLAFFRNQSIVSQFLGENDKYRNEILKRPYRLVYITEEAEQQEPVRDIPIRSTISYPLRTQFWWEDSKKKKYILDDIFNDCVHFFYVIKGIFLKSMRKISELPHDFVHFCYVIKGIFLKFMRKISELAKEIASELTADLALEVASELGFDPSDCADFDSNSIEESGEEESGIDDDKDKLYKKSLKYINDYANWTFLILKRIGELRLRF